MLPIRSDAGVANVISILISVLGRDRSELIRGLGPLLATSELREQDRPPETTIAPSGRVADEVHWWPFARQGDAMGLELHLSRGTFCAIRWGVSIFK